MFCWIRSCSDATASADVGVIGVCGRDHSVYSIYLGPNYQAAGCDRYAPTLVKLALSSARRLRPGDLQLMIFPRTDRLTYPKAHGVTF